LGAVQGLNLALLVGGEHNGVLWRIQIEAPFADYRTVADTAIAGRRGL
jgi:hypothetical protein